MAPRPVDIAGQKFNLLVAVGPSRTHTEPCGKKTAMWFFRCDCGKVKELRKGLVTAGKTKSCGCLLGAYRDGLKLPAPSVDRSHYLYRLWTQIKSRTGNPEDRRYQNYGGRGISMHPGWVSSFETFRADIERECGDRPPGCSIDRINNDGDYEPGNVRWATSSEQASNRRCHRTNAEFDEMRKDRDVWRTRAIEAGWLS